MLSIFPVAPFLYLVDRHRYGWWRGLKEGHNGKETHPHGHCRCLAQGIADKLNDGFQRREIDTLTDLITGVQSPMGIRPCRVEERAAILRIIDAAAEAYRGIIPPNFWHEPYMRREELASEIAAGVAFWGYETGGRLVGVMGIQPVRDVDLIRHAYVLPEAQRGGIGSALLSHLRGQSVRQMLIGTWAAADWAIRFYRSHGFVLVPTEQKTRLLKTYWTVPDQQIETSVVLANPAISSQK